MELKGYLFGAIFTDSCLYRLRSSGLFWALSTLTLSCDLSWSTSNEWNNTKTSVISALASGNLFCYLEGGHKGSYSRTVQELSNALAAISFCPGPCLPRGQPKHSQGGLRGQIRRYPVGSLSHTIVIKELCLLEVGAASLSGLNFKVMALSSGWYPQNTSDFHRTVLVSWSWNPGSQGSLLQNKQKFIFVR